MSADVSIQPVVTPAVALAKFALQHTRDQRDAALLIASMSDTVDPAVVAQAQRLVRKES